jgi:hypothetical protein
MSLCWGIDMDLFVWRDTVLQCSPYFSSNGTQILSGMQLTWSARPKWSNDHSNYYGGNPNGPLKLV